MKNLFEEYNNKEFENDENIVRSVTPVIGSLNGANALIFKLNTIHKDEEIIKAELHFNQRHKTRAEKHKHGKKGVVAQIACPSCQRSLKEAAAGQYVTLPVERLPSKNKHWVIFDCRDLTDDSLRSNLSSLFVHFYRNDHLLHAESVIRRNTPFLLVYTATKLPLIKPSSSNEDDDSFDDEDIEPTEKESNQIYNNRVKRSISTYYSYNHDLGNDNKEIKFIEGETPMYRNRENLLQQQMEEFARTGPKALTARKHRNRRRKNRRFKSKFSDPMMGFGQVDDDEESKGKDNKTDNNSLKVLLLGKEGKQLSKNQPCGRRKFSVSFRDIGWHDVVIEPNYFDAYYCAGSCEFPLNLNANPSNHALIQSLVNTMSIYPNIPKVCCAPDKMDSLTMLFFDETGNVVLKNFPRMVVSSCSCL
uniref:TGF-beta family profile domain-containing protein n=1 Tax=Panagrolaimus sp. ES5 TaxID=591445 RepID=A0AC34FPK1_9BILA